MYDIASRCISLIYVFISVYSMGNFHQTSSDELKTYFILLHLFRSVAQDNATTYPKLIWNNA